MVPSDTGGGVNQNRIPNSRVPVLSIDPHLRAPTFETAPPVGRNPLICRIATTSSAENTRCKFKID